MLLKCVYFCRNVDLQAAPKFITINILTSPQALNYAPGVHPKLYYLYF